MPLTETGMKKVVRLRESPLVRGRTPRFHSLWTHNSHGSANNDTTLKKGISLKNGLRLRTEACAESNRKGGSRAHDHFQNSAIVTRCAITFTHLPIALRRF